VAEWQVDSAQRLIDGFSGFRKFHWNHSPIPGLKPSEVWALIVIKKEIESGEPGIRISDIGKTLRIATPTATQLVNGLEKAGYVKRNRDERDRRVVHISLTSVGQREIKKAKKRLHSVFEGLADHLGKSDSEKLTELFASVFEYFSSIDSADSK